MLFTALVLTQLLHAFSFRSESKTVWSASSLANRWLVAGLLGSMALQCFVIYLPAAQSIFQTAGLSAVHWLAVIAAAFVAIGILDATKLIVSARARRSGLAGEGR
jgi:magnesium-transporting ATPase (P-type)